MFRPLGFALVATALAFTPHATKAQTAPDLRPGPAPVLLPVPSDIAWEIPNRFSPFRALQNPADTFNSFAFLPGETTQDWHARLWLREGENLVSPYADALNTGAQTPWDAEAELPTGPVLDWLRGEDDTEARLNISLSYPHVGPCRWEAGDTRILSPDCATPITVSIPQSGLAVSLRLGASPAAATTLVKPKHEVILGLGDSYGSGEGNPDPPTTWEPWFTPPQGDTRWLVREIGIDREPKWLDAQCNRSFFSYQSLAALKRASDDPHLLITFIHLACTGAEIFNGILAPQIDPGGEERINRFSQLNAAQHVLCRRPLGLNYQPYDAGLASLGEIERFKRRNGSTLRLLDRFDVNTRAQRGETSRDEPRSGMLDCPSGQLRAPEHIFLSVGGNDIGFGDLVRYFLVPFDADLALLNSFVLPEVCPDPAYRYGDPELAVTSHCVARDQQNGDHTGSLIGDANDVAGFEARYAFLIDAFRHYLEVSAEQIAVVQYPDPLRRGVRLPPSIPDPILPGAGLELNAESSLRAPLLEALSAPNPSRPADCTHLLIQPELVHGSPPGLDPLSPWAALSAEDPLEFTADWAFNVRPDEALNLLRQFETMRESLTNVALDQGLTYACAGRDAFVGHGWWEGSLLNLPSHGEDGQRWRPVDWQPYAFDPEGRAVRTTNDSFLTQKEVYGTVHPNLMGHSILADILIDRLDRP